jgi:nitric oxide dioxygenase
MTPQQIDVVQSSFAKVVPIADAAAALFYARLFEIAPRVKPLFHGDMTEQGRKLMMTLGVVVNGLRDLDAIAPAAQALAVKHVGYGVKALLWTLQRGLGEAYTAEVAANWTTAYATLSGAMIAAAHGEEAAA